MKFPPIFFFPGIWRSIKQTLLFFFFLITYRRVSLPDVVRRTFCMISVRSEKFKMTWNTAISAQVSLHSLRNKTNNEQGKSEKENS